MLWKVWWELVCELRPACARAQTFLWMGVCLAGMTVRSVTEQCMRLGLNPVLIGTGVINGTGNLLDTGSGVSRVYKVPRSTTGFPFDLSIPNPQVTYLSDSQDNSAWAAFAAFDYDISDTWQASFALRYDEDTREQTTETPPGFIPGAARAFRGAPPGPGGCRF